LIQINTFFVVTLADGKSCCHGFHSNGNKADRLPAHEESLKSTTNAVNKSIGTFILGSLGCLATPAFGQSTSDRYIPKPSIPGDELMPMTSSFTTTAAD